MVSHRSRGRTDYGPAALRAIADSAEEILYIVSGEGEAHAGDERGPVQAGDLAVIPAMVPHGIANTGDEPLKVVGFFCESEIVSEFQEPLQPMGLSADQVDAVVVPDLRPA